jgi:hypothetical protein
VVPRGLPGAVPGVTKDCGIVPHRGHLGFRMTYRWSRPRSSWIPDDLQGGSGGLWGPPPRLPPSGCRPARVSHGVSNFEGPPRVPGGPRCTAGAGEEGFSTQAQHQRCLSWACVEAGRAPNGQSPGKPRVARSLTGRAPPLPGARGVLNTSGAVLNTSGGYPVSYPVSYPVLRHRFPGARCRAPPCELGQFWSKVVMSDILWL